MKPLKHQNQRNETTKTRISETTETKPRIQQQQKTKHPKQNNRGELNLSKTTRDDNQQTQKAKQLGISFPLGGEGAN